ncbi:MAG: type I restriction enzyme HsdR N-terminal domain-containing protein [Prevotella sp.]|jgi:type I site-specific restriction-modification system R (restriction) subunit|uniref:type I restriction enzyme HsdR N-terminal domain-containing protein n=1 Tax=unclassified Dysgonomonas TaxID=2630389 RepID=UPI0025C13527|nr:MULTISPECIES: type I restriction enzyme HsdR N-terminal domain-containing protein [unclassified Dysgonomonas]MDR1505059.1 type I restriction enzyme HsdR N-terminal domain-containing protein [Prevotella sp.]MDR1716275.1 type I restriction enzyme HsdR N-terminal domain-containing protein [Prevotella sp.]MDR2003730.1 type I restriction enzyme HsdR N-terminal domain-containing protein [Prevotella sp.]HMM01530.1 type I restriction enzyme HsdR N-terminal domain-containing protein [Dysgonomonas sp.
MLDLNLPPFNINVKKTDGRLSVFDRLRRKFVTLTPEEWVRQHFINYLITEKGYPQALIANEIQINLNNQKRRCDSIVYDKTISPLVIVEYKSPDVEITQAVFDQIVRYNIVLKVKYLIVSNGLSHYCCRMDYSTQTFEYLADIPTYTEL